ncbi:Arp2/3 complex, 34kD subunit p34-Arc family protein [Tritrichomonas foetus]|uniref:Arp2/3 complex 34 kDa subunit n=1 Tax=Tritrichomonas foetus TaxID=1144522 RepID=A0A1J4KCI0_9EUKA|nr:Arp2/3 complex, 34kD subunit p34-Arc family protein [Tritrichomonas foetus]|eukprot:OHT09129.1 Arp2/3 complex, 34kD subunit p34-Arc family protein [Tritrichomonas foetus]
MIILEYESAILRNLLERSLDPNENLSGEYTFCDFDGVRFYVKLSKAHKSKEEKKSKDGESDIREILVMIYLSCAEQINEYGGEEHFDNVYGSIKTEPITIKGSPVQFTHAVKFTLFDKTEAERSKLITLVSRLKAHILGAPFIYVSNLVKEGSNFAPFEIPYRGQTGESIYITPTEKGAAATYSIRFSDEGDKVIGGVFFQELTAARARVPSAPAVTYSNDPPSDLSAFSLPTRDQKLFAYVTIGMQDAQLSDRKKEDISFYMPMFRDYLHYHIKCAKGFMHQKMRARTAAMLKILDAAKPEPKQKVRRTITGKVMQ